MTWTFITKVITVRGLRCFALEVLINHFADWPILCVFKHLSPVSSALRSLASNSHCFIHIQSDRLPPVNPVVSKLDMSLPSPKQPTTQLKRDTSICSHLQDLIDQQSTETIGIQQTAILNKSIEKRYVQVVRWGAKEEGAKRRKVRPISSVHWGIG